MVDKIIKLMNKKYLVAKVILPFKDQYLVYCTPPGARDDENFIDTYYLVTKTGDVREFQPTDDMPAFQKALKSKPLYVG